MSLFNRLVISSIISLYAPLLIVNIAGLAVLGMWGS